MIYAIVAVDSAFGIGKDGTISWKSSADFAHFKQTTMGSAIMMGKNTWVSIGSKPLPNRRNIVVSTTMPSIDHTYDVVHPNQIPSVIDRYTGTGLDLFLIGGKHLLDEYSNRCSEIIITLVPGDYDCDVKLSPDIIRGYVRYKTATLSDGLIVEYYRK